ncbi:MAG: NAD-dependent epimerase/dehydratase family protein [bacterium]|nr:NAD-dependent epimerase/dehydratase family protein [bacterium]
MRVLVTGATGLLGNNVVRQLAELPEKPTVTVLVRNAADNRPFEGLEVQKVTGDLLDRAALAAACKDQDAVIHSAGYVHIGWRQMETSQAVNVDGAKNVAIAAREAGAKMVHVSSVNALGMGAVDALADEETPLGGNVPCGYVLTKRESEVVVQEQVELGLDASIVNPGFMLGPWDWKPSSGKMFLEVANNFTPIGPHGGISVCDVRDVAAGVLSAMQKGRAGRRYILAGENMYYFDLWKIFAEVSGTTPPRIRPRGPILAMIGGFFGDVTTRITGREPELNSAATAMSNQFHYYSSQRAIDELGYQTRPVRESAEAAWKWFVEHGYAKTK